MPCPRHPHTQPGSPFWKVCLRVPSSSEAVHRPLSIVFPGLLFLGFSLSLVFLGCEAPAQLSSFFSSVLSYKLPIASCFSWPWLVHPWSDQIAQSAPAPLGHVSSSLLSLASFCPQELPQNPSLVSPVVSPFVLWLGVSGCLDGQIYSFSQ